MCGIAGLCFSTTGERTTHAARVSAMLDAIRHRGPDSRSHISEEFAEVAFVRLAVMDPSRGDQPFHSRDGEISCYLNGEIFNHRALREGLERRGVEFRSTSDAEILPHLYELHGESMFAMLEGMFVVCVVDRGRREVLLARDPVGVKQIYYFERDGVVGFASELKGLLASGLAPTAIDPAKLLSLLTLFYVPNGETVLRGVRSAPPGCFVTIGASSEPQLRRHSTLPTEPLEGISEAEAEARARDGLIRGVESQLDADVPVGLSLSGGVDSSALAWALAELGHTDVPTFTVTYEDTPTDEAESARQLARALGLPHTLLTPAAADLERDLPRLAWLSDAPICDPALYSQYLVAQEARRHVTVLLSGAGGDELFGGYPSYLLSRRQNAFLQAPRPFRRLVASVLGDEKLQALAQCNGSRLPIHCLLMSSLDREDFRLFRARGLDPDAGFDHLREAFRRHQAHDARNQQMLTDLDTYLPEQLLAMIDRATAACSLEGRVPLLDIGMIRAVAGLPSATKLGSPPWAKRLLKRVIRDRTPQIVLTREKIGLPSPMKRFVADARGALIPAILLRRDSPLREWLPTDWIERKLASGGRSVSSFRAINTLLVFAAWHRWFIELERTDEPDCDARELFSLTARDVQAS